MGRGGQPEALDGKAISLLSGRVRTAVNRRENDSTRHPVGISGTILIGQRVGP